MQIPVPTIKPPELPPDIGVAGAFKWLRDVMYSWWFWVGVFVLLAVVSWIIITGRNRREGK